MNIEEGDIFAIGDLRPIATWNSFFLADLRDVKTIYIESIDMGDVYIKSRNKEFTKTLSPNGTWLCTMKNFIHAIEQGVFVSYRKFPHRSHLLEID